MQTLKEIMNDKINKNLIYENIINYKKNKNINILSFGLVLSCSLIIMIFLYSNSNKKFKDINPNSINIVVNKITEDKFFNSINDKSKEIKFEDIDLYKLSSLTDADNYNISNIEIPKYLDNIYCKSKYINNSLYKYVINYKNNNNTKDIILEISKIKSNMWNYYNNLENITSSYIKNIEVKVFIYNDKYIAFFTINDYNFDIEAVGLDIEELEEFIKLVMGK